MAPVFLMLPREGLAFEVQITWRRDQDLGLKFRSRYDLNAPSPACPAILLHLWRGAPTDAGARD
jgi:hypothetical protein